MRAKCFLPGLPRAAPVGERGGGGRGVVLARAGSRKPARRAADASGGPAIVALHCTSFPGLLR